VKKLLVIAYFLPPAGDVGVYRTLKFMKYLPQFGWQPVALTTSNGTFGKVDETLLDLIPEGVEVHRTPGLEARRPGGDGTSPRRTPWTLFRRLLWRMWYYICIPDMNIGWVPAATWQALRIVRRERIDHVYVSGKPFSSFLVGCFVKMFAGTRLVIDYRDPWTLNFNYERRSRLHVWIERRMEAWIVRKSDVVIANTRHNNERMIEEFGRGERREKFVTIHNGFDSDDFVAAPDRTEDTFTITYAGAFYYSVGSDYGKQAGDAVMRTYSPLYFFDALEKLFERRPDIKESIRVKFMGRLGRGYDPVIAEKGLEGVVERLGYIDYREHIAVLKASSALLLVLSRGEQSRGWVPSKFFQYLGSGNPILALVPGGEVRSIIGEAQAGVCIEPDDVDAIAVAVEEMFDRHASGELARQRNDQEVGKYERRYLTELLARALDAA
jgi:glycosyltransferase involved in cell wall biosynthesis